MDQYLSITFREMSVGDIIRHFEDSKKSLLAFRETFCENFPANPLLHTAERADFLKEINRFLNQQTPFDFMRTLFERSCHKHVVSPEVRTEKDFLIRQFLDERNKMIKDFCLGQTVLHGRKLERSVELLFTEGSSYHRIISFFKEYYTDPKEIFSLPPYPGVGFDEESAGFPLEQPPIPWKS